MVEKNSSKYAITRRDFIESGIQMAGTVGIATDLIGWQLKTMVTAIWL